MTVRALVIQDHDGLARAQCLLLHRLGIACVWVETGEEALDLVARERFDLVLVDDSLPDLSGREITRMLRLGAVESPVIYVSSAAHEPDIRAQAREAGVDAFLQTPFTATAFDKAVAEVMPRYRGFGPWSGTA